ncbi:MAG: LysE family translocator [Paracoccaceae bacterium]
MENLFLSLGAVAMTMLLATMSPGPNMIAVISSTVSSGRNAGLMTGLGIVTGALCWSVAALAGLAGLFEYFPNVAIALRMIGAMYLIWLGIRSLKSMRQGAALSISRGERTSKFTAFRVGYVICMTNPKALLFFGSVLTALVPAGAQLWWNVAAVLVIISIGSMMHTLTAILFSRPAVLARYLQSRRAISGVFGILFIGFGGKIALDTFKQLRA